MKNQNRSYDKENSSVFNNTDQKKQGNSKFSKEKKLQFCHGKKNLGDLDNSIKEAFESFCQSDSDILSFRELKERVLRRKEDGLDD